MYYIFHINPAIKWVVLVFPFDIQSIAFSFDYVFNPEFVLVNLLQLFFKKYSNNFFTFKISSNVFPCYSVRYFLDHKYFLTLTWNVAFCKKFFIFWYSHMVANFGFRIFVIMLNTIFNLLLWLNISSFHFYWSTLCFAVFVNYFTKLIDVYIFWYRSNILANFIL